MRTIARFEWLPIVHEVLLISVKIDRIDHLYYVHSSRIDLKEETRINATSNEAEDFHKQHESDNGVFALAIDHAHTNIVSMSAPPNFISDIFYITLAMGHYGYSKTITTFEDLARQHDDMTRHLEQLEGDGSWRSVRNYLRLAQD